MYKSNINSLAKGEFCCECGQYSEKRVHLLRIDVFNGKKGKIIAADLFENVFCSECFILQYLNIYNELHITVSRKKPYSKKKRRNAKGHD